MSHSNPNRRERAAAKVYAKVHGVSYQNALQTLRQSKAAQPGITAMMKAAEARITAAEATFSGASHLQLMNAVEELVADRGRSMNEFTPLDLVEGDIEESTLVRLDAKEIEAVEDAELISAEGQSIRYGVHTRLVGVGDIDWYVSAPSGYDVASYGDSMGGDSGGPGLVQELEPAVPVQLHVWGVWNPDDCRWTEIEIQYATMPDDESDRRARRHSDQETTRLQAAGILPSDDEIDGMAYPLWRAMDARPRHSPRDLARADVPTDAGVYAWYRQGAAIYVGKASSLQTRLWSNHLGRGPVMTNSAFRRNVAAHLQIASANDIKTGAYQLTPPELLEVRTFIEGCAVAWVPCGDAADAEDLERRMKHEWLPPLTRI